jgi:aminomethyltransferase
MCNEQGSIVDGLLVYKVSEGDYFIVVNTADRAKDFAWMTSHAMGDVAFEDVSRDIAQISLQGPAAETILRALVANADIPQAHNVCNFHRYVDRVDALISRTGDTGEDGFELYLPTAGASQIWRLLLKAGREYGLMPYGLGARDTLQFEAAVPIYGHESEDAISPIEAGLGEFVKMDKPAFIGRSALLAMENPVRRCVGLRVTGCDIACGHQIVYAGDEIAGYTTVGAYCPSLKGFAARAIVRRLYSQIGTHLQIDVEGRRMEAEVVKMPFYRRHAHNTMI